MFKPTNKMLQNDLSAMKLHHQRDQAQIENLSRRVQTAEAVLASTIEDRNNWLLAFKTLAKLVK